MGTDACGDEIRHNACEEGHYRIIGVDTRDAARYSVIGATCSDGSRVVSCSLRTRRLKIVVTCRRLAIDDRGLCSEL